MESGNWLCSDCSRMDSIENNKLCRSCQRRMSKKFQSSSWSCSRCSFLNVSNVDICQMCEQEKERFGNKKKKIKKELQSSWKNQNISKNKNEDNNNMINRRGKEKEKGNRMVSHSIDRMEIDNVDEDENINENENINMNMEMQMDVNMEMDMNIGMNMNMNSNKNRNENQYKNIEWKNINHFNSSNKFIDKDEQAIKDFLEEDEEEEQENQYIHIEKQELPENNTSGWWGWNWFGWGSSKSNDNNNNNNNNNKMDKKEKNIAFDDIVQSISHTHDVHKKQKQKKKKNNFEKNLDNGTSMFKDVQEILNKEANEHERIAKEEEEVTELMTLYKPLHELNKNQRNPFKITSNYLQDLMKYVPPRTDANQNKENTKPQTFTECQVCHSEFDDKKYAVIQMRKYCKHAMICRECFVHYLQLKIKDEDILPWLRCPAEECFQPIHPDILLEELQQQPLIYFARTFISKHLVRNPNWIKCQNDKSCSYGFVVLQHEKQETKKKCELCGLKQMVSRNPIKSDQGFQELIKSGVLRLCPKCEFPTMKDKGLCNVMQCGQCGIWWNWRTYEFGTNSRDLKETARMQGTLWEKGELHYQQRLERENPEEFKKLLESNGIRYDPNYVRGT